MAQYGAVAMKRCIAAKKRRNMSPEQDDACDEAELDEVQLTQLHEVRVHGVLTQKNGVP